MSSERLELFIETRVLVFPLSTLRSCSIKHSLQETRRKFKHGHSDECIKGSNSQRQGKGKLNQQGTVQEFLWSVRQRWKETVAKADRVAAGVSLGRKGKKGGKETEQRSFFPHTSFSGLLFHWWNLWAKKNLLQSLTIGSQNTHQGQGVKRGCKGASDPEKGITFILSIP